MNSFKSTPLGRLGIRYPIIQAPMAGTSTPSLAAAVSNAGALGSIGIGASTPQAALLAIQETLKLTSKPFNVNVFVHSKAIRNVKTEKKWIEFLKPKFEEFGGTPPMELKEIYKSFNDDPEVLEVLLETRPKVVSFHFGLPPPEVIEKLKAQGKILLATATNLLEAQAIEAAGIDMIVAQGYEAGGHRGCFDPEKLDDQLSTVALVQLLVSQIEIPVIAAGRIMDGRGIASALSIGATAVQLGTAFILCPESAADEGYRKALQGEGAYHTRMTPLISGRPARSLRNRFTALHEELDGNVQAAYPLTYDIGKALHGKAKEHGEHGYGAHWAGQGAPLARSMPAAELVETLMREAGQL